MRVLRNHPIPGKLPTHSLVKVLGLLAETGNLSPPRQGISTLQSNPCKMRQTTDFHLIKNFCCSQPLLPPSFKIWTSVWVQDSETKQLQEMMCARGTLPCSTVECILLETAKPFHSLPIPHPNCEGRRENCRNSVHQSWTWDATAPCPGPPLELGEEHPMKTVYLEAGFLQSKPDFLVHRSWLSLLSLLPTPLPPHVGSEVII